MVIAELNLESAVSQIIGLEHKGKPSIFAIQSIIDQTRDKSTALCGLRALSGLGVDTDTLKGIATNHNREVYQLELGAQNSSIFAIDPPYIRDFMIKERDNYVRIELRNQFDEYGNYMPENLKLSAFGD